MAGRVEFVPARNEPKANLAERVGFVPARDEPKVSRGVPEDQPLQPNSPDVANLIAYLQTR